MQTPLVQTGKSFPAAVTLFRRIIIAAVKNAKAAANASAIQALVALDIGPIGELLEPTGTLSFEEAYDIFAEEITAGVTAGADLIVLGNHDRPL